MRALLLLSIACGPTESSQQKPVSTDAHLAHAERASLALRGVRLAADERARVESEAGVLDELVEAWVDDPRFLETVRDVHAGPWWLRSDTRSDPPGMGPLETTGTAVIEAAFQEEPLQLVADVVARGRPYTDIVTVDYTMIDATLSAAYGLPYDPEGPEWQAAHYEDGRPSAGVLTTNGLWLRHLSGFANAHRSRASWLARSLLCDDLAARDLPITSIPHDEGDALRSDVACQGCHQSLDPLAANFFGFRYAVGASEMGLAWKRSCPPSLEHACYPLDLYQPEEADGWVESGLPNPGFYGLPADHFGQLGRQIAADPRFASCAVRHFWSWLAQDDLYGSTVTPPIVDELTEGFRDSGFDVKWLAAAVVTSETFAAAPPQVLRPEQLDRMLRQLTGFTWQTGELACEPGIECRGLLGLLTSDEAGMRTLAGGQDGWDVLQPVHAPTSTQQLVFAVAAEKAAAHVVALDLARPAEERRLLTMLGPLGEAGPKVVEDQIRDLVVRIHGAKTPGLVAELVPLWEQARDRHDDVGPAWELVIAVLIQDPATWVY